MEYCGILRPLSRRRPVSPLTLKSLTSGGLKGHSRHWSPRQTPPLPESLPQLESLPPRFLPQIGPLIEPWSTRPMAALEPVQEGNSDFEYGWKTADGSGWGRTIQSREESQHSLRWSCDDVTESQSSEMITKGSSIADDYRTRRRWWSQHMLGEEGFNRLWDVVPRVRAPFTSAIDGMC